MFYRVYFQGDAGKFEVGSYEGNRATYLGMIIAEAGGSDFEGVILDSANYEGGN